MPKIQIKPVPLLFQLALFSICLSGNAAADRTPQVNYDGITLDLGSIGQPLINLPFGHHIYAQAQASLDLEWGWPPKISGDVGAEIGLHVEANGDRVGIGGNVFGGPYLTWGSKELQATWEPFDKPNSGSILNSDGEVVGFETWIGPGNISVEYGSEASNQDPAPGPGAHPGGDALPARQDPLLGPNRHPDNGALPPLEASPLEELLAELEAEDQANQPPSPLEDLLMELEEEDHEREPNEQSLPEREPGASESSSDPKNPDTSGSLKEPADQQEDTPETPTIITIAESGSMYEDPADIRKFRKMTTVIKGSRGELLSLSEPNQHIYRCARIRIIDGPDAGTVGWVPLIRVALEE